MDSSYLDKQINDFIKFKDVKQITKESYKRILLEYLKYVKTLSQPPTREDIKTYREKLLSHLGARTVQKHIVVIRNFYQWVYAEGKGENIAISIKGVRISDTYAKEPLSEKESQKLIIFAKNKSGKGIVELRNYAIISLMITTGLRTIEVSRADVNDIHFVEDAQALFVMGKGRDDKDAYVKLSPIVYDIIMNYLYARSDNNKPLFINHGRNHKGTRIGTKTISTMVKEYLRDIGIDDKLYTAHSLRHTAAVIAMNNGAPLFSTQQLLRHKSPSTTQIYLQKITRRKEFYEKEISNTVFGKTVEQKKD